MKKISMSIIFMLTFIAFTAITALAQRETQTNKKLTTVQKKNSISVDDQKAIRELFKDVDPKEYRLEFNKGKEVAGAKPISMQEIRQIKTVRTPGNDKASIVFVVRDDGVMYVFASTKSKLQSLLGKEKMAKLNSIMAKYQ